MKYCGKNANIDSALGVNRIVCSPFSLLFCNWIITGKREKQYLFMQKIVKNKRQISQFKVYIMSYV